MKAWFLTFTDLIFFLGRNGIWKFQMMSWKIGKTFRDCDQPLFHARVKVLELHFPSLAQIVSLSLSRLPALKHVFFQKSFSNVTSFILLCAQRACCRARRFYSEFDLKMKCCLSFQSTRRSVFLFVSNTSQRWLAFITHNRQWRAWGYWW